MLTKYKKLLEAFALSENLVLELEQRDQQHVLENFILVALLSQIKSIAENLHAEKTSKSYEFSILQSEAIELKEENEELKSKLTEKDCKEKLLAIEIENLGSSLGHLQGAYNDLQREKFELQEEKTSMAKEISVLEEENTAIFEEVLSLECISSIFKNWVIEKSLELKMLSADVDKVNYINSEKGEKLSLAERMVEEQKLENLNLAEALQSLEDELSTMRLLKSHLDHDIEVKNSSLLEKEHKIQEMEQKLCLIENEKLELHQNQEIQARTTSDLKKQIIALTEECDYLGTENGKMKNQNEELHSKLQTQISDTHKLESEMEELFGELQISTFFNFMYEQKVDELMQVTTAFESEKISKEVDIKLLNDENEKLKSQLAMSLPAIASLMQCISSLEKHAYGKLQTHHKAVTKAVEEEEKHNSSGEEKNGTEMTPLADVQDLVTRIQAVEKTLLKAEHLNRHHPEGENGILTKDIMLDQISESSPYNITNGDQLELWETTAITAAASDSEKELGVDKFSDGNRKKALERLNSDLVQLTNLQIAVLGLKKKLEITENVRRDGKAEAERESLKAQLNEARVSVQKLFDQNDELRRRFESGPRSDSEGRVSEEARRMSEKIGRLQMEVEKMQGLLVKQDDYEKSRISEARRKVMLKDYLYGGAKPSQTPRKKKKKFCSCIQPRDD